MISSVVGDDPRRGGPAFATWGNGTALVLGLVAIAVGLGLFALWFQWRQTRRCLDFYGSETAGIIQRARRVEVWERPSTIVRQATAGEDRRDAMPDDVTRYDVTAARGLVHLRRGLVEDANLDWSRRDGESIGDDAWDLALVFFDSSDPSRPAAILRCDRSDGGGTLGVAGRPGRVGLGRLASGIERWWKTARAGAPRVVEQPVGS